VEADFANCQGHVTHALNMIRYDAVCFMCAKAECFARLIYCTEPKEQKSCERTKKCSNPLYTFGMGKTWHF